MAFTIQDILGGTLLDSVKGLISQFHMAPDDKAKLQQAIQQEQDTFAAAENDYNAKLNDIAGANIRAEQQGGPYERNARPSVIWIGLFAIVWNYCGPMQIINHFLHTNGGPIDLPAYFWEAWTAISLGYVFNRTAEKIAQMPGDSSIKLPFGLGGIQQNSPK